MTIDSYGSGKEPPLVYKSLEHKTNKSDPGDAKAGDSDSTSVATIAGKTFNLIPSPSNRLIAKQKWKSACRLVVDRLDKKAFQIGEKERDLVVTAQQLFPCFRKHLLGGYSDDQMMDICRFLARQILLSREPKGSRHYDYFAHLEPGDRLRMPPKSISHPFSFSDPVYLNRLGEVISPKKPRKAFTGALLSKMRVREIELDFLLWMSPTADGRKMDLLLTHAEEMISRVRKGACVTTFKAQKFEVPFELESQRMGETRRYRAIKYAPMVLISPNPLKEGTGRFKTIKDQDLFDRQRSNKATKLHRQLVTLSKRMVEKPGILEVPKLLGPVGSTIKEYFRVEKFQDWINTDFEKALEEEKIPLDFEGKSFRNISSAESVDLLLQVSVYLEKLFHRNGYVHRDIKLPNILIGAKSSILPLEFRIIDFGLSEKTGHSIKSGRYFLWDKATRNGWCLPTSDVYALNLDLAFILMPLLHENFTSIPLYFDEVLEDEVTNGKKKIFASIIQDYLKCNIPSEAPFQQIQMKIGHVSALNEIYDEFALLERSTLSDTDRNLIQKFKRELKAIDSTYRHFINTFKQSEGLSEYLDSDGENGEMRRIRELFKELDYTQNRGPGRKQLESKEKREKEKSVQALMPEFLKTLEYRFPALTMRAFQDKCKEMLAILSE